MVGRSDIFFFAALWASSRREFCYLVSRQPAYVTSLTRKPGLQHGTPQIAGT